MTRSALRRLGHYSKCLRPVSALLWYTLLKQNIQNLAFSCWLGQHGKHKLGRGWRQPTKIPYWWNLWVYQGFSSCTHGSPAEFAGKVPRSPSNASPPHKGLTYQPTQWPLWDFTCPLLTHCRGLWLPPEPSLWVLLTLLLPLPVESQHRRSFPSAAVEAVISACLAANPLAAMPLSSSHFMTESTETSGRLTRTMKAKWVRCCLACQPHHPAWLKKKKKKRWWKEKGRKEPSGKKKETDWILFQNFVRILFFLFFWRDGNGIETYKMKTSISLQHCPGGLSQEN